jgi:signal transduction histidine kinase
MHGGSLELCSVAGEGTIVTVRLPKAPAAEPQTAAG